MLGKRFVVVLFVLTSTLMATPAYGVDWDLRSSWKVGGSTPSNRAYVKGKVYMYDDADGIFNEDQRFKFTARLYLQGPRRGCAHLRIKTYVGGKLTNKGYNLEKTFPADGYYRFCAPDGRGVSKIYTGSDVQDRSIGDIGRFKRATLRICWTANERTPVGGDCYSMRILGSGTSASRGTRPKYLALHY